MRKILNIALFFIILVLPLSAQWMKITNMPSGLVNGSYLDVFFLKDNPKYGWVCGFNGVTLYTQDTGKSWKASILPGSYQLESISFLNENVGYVSGDGRIFKSVNGGRTWKDITDMRSEGELWGNFFFDVNNGWVIGGGCGTNKQFFKTTNGGDSWSLFEIENSDSKMSDLIMESPDGIGYASGSSSIWKTTNGGRLWFELCSTKLGTNDWQEEITLKNKTMLVPYSYGCNGNYESNVGGVRITTDLGNSWKTYSTNAAMFGSFLIDEKTGWGVGFDKTIVYTSDAGENWEMRNCGIPDGVSLDDIFFVNDTLGFVVGIGIYKYHPFVQSNVALNVDGKITVCDDKEIVLTTKDKYKKYRWSTGETSNSIKVNKSGYYSVYVEKEFICDSVTSKPVFVKFLDKPNFEIQSTSNNPCEGDTVSIKVNSVFVSYKWFNGDTTNSTKVSKSGTYQVTVIDSNGCENTKSITINFYPNPKPKIYFSRKPNICIGDSLFLSTDNIYTKYEWYFSNDQFTTSKLISNSSVCVAKDSGLYCLKIQTNQGCLNKSDTVLVTVRLDTNRIKLVLFTEKDSIDFETVKYPLIQCKNVEITNVSWKELLLDAVYFAKNFNYSIPQNQLPIKIEPGKSVQLLLCFSPKVLGKSRDTLIVADNCGDHTLPVVGYGLLDTLEDDIKCDLKVKIIPIDIGELKISDPYPNPADNFVETFIEVSTTLSDNMDINAEIYNLMGEKITKGEVVNEKIIYEKNYQKRSLSMRFNISNLKTDKYYLKLNILGNQIIQPIIIVH